MGNTAEGQLGAIERTALATMRERGLADAESPLLLMVSGGSDSTALAYCMACLRGFGLVGKLGILHVNHRLRGRDADEDEAFVGRLAEALGVPLFTYGVDVADEAAATHANVEAVGRTQRYLAANRALEGLCVRAGAPLSSGRIVTAHTLDDRIENFYMRSIVGTGPGGFRAMLYQNGRVIRPLLDLSRDSLRAYVHLCEQAGRAVVHDGDGKLWREDATNAHTDRFRAFVRHEIVPKARERNPRLHETLRRTMNLIADEDDLMEDMARKAIEAHVGWLKVAAAPSGETAGAAAGDGAAATAGATAGVGDFRAGCVLAPTFFDEPIAVQRRAVYDVLKAMLPPDVRVEAASVEAVLAGWEAGGGYVANIQGDIAVSANKRGVRIEPMAAYRARRKPDRA